MSRLSSGVPCLNSRGGGGCETKNLKLKFENRLKNSIKIKPISFRDTPQTSEKRVKSIYAKLFWIMTMWNLSIQIFQFMPLE